MDLASGPTFSRLENAVSTKDLYRLARAFVDQFIASYPQPPAVIVLDLDHSEDPTHGQQEFSFYNQYYGHHCYLPLFLFEGLSGQFITAALRPGKRPTGAENAMIVRRVLERLRAAWPQTRIILRGDAHFANPELMHLAVDDPAIDFLLGSPVTAPCRPWPSRSWPPAVVSKPPAGLGSRCRPRPTPIMRSPIGPNPGRRPFG